MLLSVVTPTYNRAHLLPRLYESLCTQAHKDIEWIIVNDGSTDDTEDIVKSFIQDKLINIRYFHQPNGGKHRAINLAVKNADGELIFIADSDDWLPQNSLSAVISAYMPIRFDKRFAGICGLDQYEDGTLVGSGLPAEILDATSQQIRERWHITGDMKEVFKTDILRKIPFPEIEGEKFCPEVLLWNRIGREHILRYINKPIYTVEYQPDGITARITRARMQSPLASMMTYSEWFDQTRSFIQRLRLAINYWRFAYCAPKNKRIGISGWGKLLFPLGALYNHIDKHACKSSK